MTETDKQHRLNTCLAERILILDGAMGTMIQQYQLTEDDFRGQRFHDWPCSLQGNNDLINLTQPDILNAIHCEYLQAGADIIETNTFNANRISQADYHCEQQVYELNRRGAEIAKAACTEFSTIKKPRFVAGVLGPTNRTASLSPDVNNPSFRNITFNQLVESYDEAITGLIDGGADLLLVETIFDTLNAKAALFAIETYFVRHNTRYPIIISGTITDASGRTLSGQTTEAFYHSVRHVQPLAVGLNCALGPEQLRSYVATLSQINTAYVSVHPNAGLPNELGQYELSATAMATQIAEWASAGLVNIVGGCCGTTPEHIQAIAQAVAQIKPRVLPTIEPRLILSGLETLQVR